MGFNNQKKTIAALSFLFYCLFYFDGLAQIKALSFTDTIDNEVAFLDYNGGLFLFTKNLDYAYTNDDIVVLQNKTNIIKDVSNKEWTIYDDVNSRYVFKLIIEGQNAGEIQISGRLYEGNKGGTVPAGNVLWQTKFNGTTLICITENGDMYVKNRIEINKYNTNFLFVSPEADGPSYIGTFDQPFKSIQEAQTFLRSSGISGNSGTMSHDTTVYILGENQIISNSNNNIDSLVFSESDSGNHDCFICYKGYPGANPILSGGIKINNWTSTYKDVDGDGYGDTILYVADVGYYNKITRENCLSSDPNKEVWINPNSPNDWFRQIYVDGYRALRSREPNLNFDANGKITGDSFFYVKDIDWNTKRFKLDYSYTDTSINKIINDVNGESNEILKNIEFVVLREWTSSRLRIGKFEDVAENPWLSGAGDYYLAPCTMERNYQFPYSIEYDPYTGIDKYGDDDVEHGDYDDDSDIDIDDMLYWKEDTLCFQTNPGAPFFFENSLRFLDQQGEFYLDVSERKLYYWPYPEELDEGNNFIASVIAPHADRILWIQSFSNQNPKPLAENILFKNLDLSYSMNRSNIDQRSGMDQNGFQGMIGIMPVLRKGRALDIADCDWLGLPYHSIINLAHSKNILFVDNLINHSGGGGIYCADNVNNCIFFANVFKDISADGVAELGWINGPEYNTYNNNYFRECGIEYYGSNGITLCQSGHTTVMNNELEDLYYNGIQSGYVDNNIHRDHNVISCNRIHDSLKMVQDGSGIFLGFSQGESVISGNYVYETNRLPWYQPFWSGSHCYYFDLGVSGKDASHKLVISNNVSDGLDVPEPTLIGWHETTEWIYNYMISNGVDGKEIGEKYYIENGKNYNYHPAWEIEGTTIRGWELFDPSIPDSVSLETRFIEFTNNFTRANQNNLNIREQSGIEEKYQYIKNK